MIKKFSFLRNIFLRKSNFSIDNSKNLEKYEYNSDLGRFNEKLQNIPEVIRSQSILIKENKISDIKTLESKINLISRKLSDQNKYKIFSQEFSRYDLLEILKSQYYLKDQSTIPFFISILHYIAKTKCFKLLNRNEFINAINHISNRLDILDERKISAFAHTLFRFQIKNDLVFKKMESLLLKKGLELSLHTISICLHSFRNVILKSKNNERFYELFQNMESVIAIKLAKGEFDRFSLCQIISIYSISENFSNEFAIILERKFLENLKIFRPREIGVIFYSFFKKGHQPETLFEEIKEYTFSKKESLNMQTITLLYESLATKLSDEEMEKIQKILVTRIETSNIHDLTKICKVSFDKKFLIDDLSSKISHVLKYLKHNIDEKTLLLLLKGSIDVQSELKPSFFYHILSRYKALIQTKRITKESTQRVKAIASRIVNPYIKASFLRLKLSC